MRVALVTVLSLMMKNFIMKEKVELARFAAKDSGGRIFNLIAYQYYLTQPNADGQQVLIKGDIEYWTDTGLPVRKIDSETFRIATTKETITRFY